MIKAANSFALFGSRAVMYESLLPLNLRAHYSLYGEPDQNWQFIINHDDNLHNLRYFPVLQQLNKDGFVLLNYVTKPNNLTKAMLWRMLPIFFGDFNFVFCRDCDSLLTPRQARCVLNFIRSGQIAHGINDNEQHSIPLMGGMVGFNCIEFKKMFSLHSFEEMLKLCGYSEDSWDIHGTDQKFLMEHIWPKVSTSSIIDNCRDKTLYPEVTLPNEAVIKTGDTFTNYIGACGLSSSLLTHANPNTIVIDFYNEHGNKNFCDYLTKIERSLLA